MEDRMTDHAASLSVEVLPGEALPPGASWDGQGTNFPLFSEHAESVELCLFDDDGAEKRLALSENTAFHWHGYLPGIGPRRRFGYDLVSYNEKHSEANLKDNRDGNDQNWSWNCGVEGPTDDPGILELRAASAGT
jgi:pullulanase/glycogen debranching enzyme